ncbi:MAG: efflux RND transporter periplasmic adaptor subunit [Acidimicrobiales bacterium]
MSDTNPDFTSPDFTSPDFLPARHQRRASRPIVVGAVVAVVALMGTWVFARSSSSADATYRTATAGVHEVQTTLDRVATVEPVSQAAVSFPVSGTVSSVAVKVGDTVSTGQALGSLDTASLQSTLIEKEAALAEANLTLEKELDGEKVGGTGSSGGGSQTPTASDTATGASATNTPTAVFAVADTSTTSASPGGTAALASASVAPTAATTAGPSEDQLRAARQAIVDAQKAVTESAAAAAAALDDATKVCASIGTDSARPASTAGTGVTTTTEAASGGSDAVAACQRATQAVLVAQQRVSTDQAAVTSAADAYSTLLDQRAASGTSGDGRPATGGATDQKGSSDQSGSTDGQPENRTDSTSPTGQGQSGTSDDSRSDSTGTQTTAPSAADLIADQKAVDAAEAAVAVARQAIAQASIVSPIDGTIVAVGFEPGQSVTGGSSTETVVVAGPGGFEVATTVTVEDLPDVLVGQAATITLDGSSAALSGEVVRIGVAPTTSTSDTTYPVVVAITDASEDLRNGATASVSIVTDEAAKVLAVPTSAVTRSGDRSTVGVLANGSVSRQQVTIGAIGREWTEIRGGLKAGATVVLADLSAALPGSATAGSSTTSNRTGPFGGFGGAGGFVGGPPGGGPPGG